MISVHIISPVLETDSADNVC